MGKALVIKGVDFSANALDVVTLEKYVPCSGITLNHSSLEFTTMSETSQLTATATPSNTTDAIIWSSSNPKIVSVSSTGLVTVNGAGEATITALCGMRSASCTIDVTLDITSSITFDYSVGCIIKRMNSVKDGDDAVVQFYADANTGNYAIGYSETATPKHIYNKKSGEYIYPVYFGHANQIAITVPDTIRATVVLVDSKHTVAVNHIDSDAARWVMADANHYDPDVSLGNRVITDIPDDADSICFTFQKPGTGITITAEDLAELQVIVS